MPESTPTPQPSPLFPLLSDEMKTSEGGQTGPADITGLVLPDLKDNTSYVDSQGLSLVPPEASPTDAAPALEKAAVEDLGTVPAGKKVRRSLQERIDQLTRKNYQTREQNEALTSQIQQLANLVAAQQQQLMQISRPASPASAPAPAPSGDPLDALLSGGQASSTPKAAPAPAVQQIDINAIVDQAINRYDQRVRDQYAQVSQLRQAQEASFEEACDILPALRDGRTAARQAFNRLFDSSPLRSEPDAPIHIALQVKGLLADEATRRPAATPEAKRAAATVVPTPTATELPEQNRAQWQKAYDDAMTKIRAGDTSFQTFKTARIAREYIKR